MSSIIMPPRRVVRDRPTRRNVEEQELPNEPEVQPQEEVTNAEFRERNSRTRGLRQGNESGQQKSNANRSSFQQKQKGPSPSSASTPAPRNKYEYNDQNSRAKPAYSQDSVAQGGSKPPACAKCGRNHSGICREGSTECFKCGQTGYFMRECPKNKKGNGNGGNRAQSSSVAPPDRATPRGATSGTGGGTNRLYAINSHQEQEDSPDVVTVDYRTRVVKFQYPNESVFE
uniref:Gag-pol protein n=1 Tax=Solanum tuberosum TaxID=4113 RepID=M1DZA5_SOLTU